MKTNTDNPTKEKANGGVGLPLAEYIKRACLLNITSSQLPGLFQMKAE